MFVSDWRLNLNQWYQSPVLEYSWGGSCMWAPGDQTSTFSGGLLHRTITEVAQKLSKNTWLMIGRTICPSLPIADFNRSDQQQESTTMSRTWKLTLTKPEKSENIFPSWKALLFIFQLIILSSSDGTDASSIYTNLEEPPMMFCNKQSFLAGHLLVNSVASQGNRWLSQSGNSLKRHLGTTALGSHQQKIER